MGNKFVAKKRALQARTTNSCTSQQTYLYTAAETLRLQTLLLNRHSKRRNQNSYERVSKIYGGLFLQGSLRKNAHVFFFANQYKPMKCVVNMRTRPKVYHVTRILALYRPRHLLRAKADDTFRGHRNEHP